MTGPLPHLLCALVLALALAACAADDPAETAIQTPTAGTEAAEEANDGPELSGTLIVQAAASLTDAFAIFEVDLEALYPDLDVVMNFAGSQALATQILEGAPADVFASANVTQIERVEEEDLLGSTPEIFLRNALAIAVEPGNPIDIGGLDDLAREDVVVVLAAPDVPAGNLAAQVLQAAGVEVTPASLEVDVRAVLSRVELGEADAGIVYVSDILAAGDAVAEVEIPESDNLLAEYPIAVVADASNPDAAAAFIDYVLSEDGQAVLVEHGFQRL
ncbi:molybdate ABC transporter substrate-binding protein [soil metagenome]